MDKKKTFNRNDRKNNYLKDWSIKKQPNETLRGQGIKKNSGYFLCRYVKRLL